ASEGERADELAAAKAGQRALADALEARRAVTGTAGRRAVAEGERHRPGEKRPPRQHASAGDVRSAHDDVLSLLRGKRLTTTDCGRLRASHAPGRHPEVRPA